MDGIEWAGAAMCAARERLETAAANLANASTDGFRALRLQGRLSRDAIAFTRTRDGVGGALRPTGRELDLAVAGDGGMAVMDARGRRSVSRGASFQRDRLGRICDTHGRYLLGEHGTLHFPQGARFDENGAVIQDGKTIDRLRTTRGTTVRSGFLESSTVDAIGEMVDLLSAERSFEAAQKVLSAIDATRERSSTQVATVRS